MFTLTGLCLWFRIRRANKWWKKGNGYGKLQKFDKHRDSRLPPPMGHSWQLDSRAGCFRPRRLRNRKSSESSSSCRGTLQYSEMIFNTSGETNYNRTCHAWFHFFHWKFLSQERLKMRGNFALCLHCYSTFFNFSNDALVAIILLIT